MPVGNVDTVIADAVVDNTGRIDSPSAVGVVRVRRSLSPEGIRDIAVAAAVTIRVDKIRTDAVVRVRRFIPKIMNKIKRD